MWEKRRFQRVAHTLSVTITPSQESAIKLSVDSRDISETGLRVRSPRMLIVDNDILVQLNLPNCPHEIMTTGQIKSCTPDHKSRGLYECGIEISISSEPDRAYWHSYISEVKKGRNFSALGVRFAKPKLKTKEEPEPEIEDPAESVTKTDYEIFIAIVLGAVVVISVLYFIVQKMTEKTGMYGVHY